MSSEVLNNVISTLLFAGTVICTYAVQSKKSNICSLSEIWIYPIKSCKGIKVSNAKVTARGLELDRIFMIVDGNGKFVSQRTYPSLSLVELSLSEQEGIIRINAPQMNTLILPIAYPSPHAAQTMVSLPVTVWGDECEGIEILGEEGNNWFCSYLQTSSLRLVRMKDDCVRSTDVRYAPKGQTSFSDCFPFMFASEASLSKLNTWLQEPVTMARFRPNFIIKGCTAFAEDTWEAVRFHALPTSNHSDVVSATAEKYIDMTLVKPCSRCIIPNIDPETGVPDINKEPSRTMKQTRSGEAIGMKEPTWKKQLFFGQHLDHEGKQGFVMSTGCNVEVLAVHNKFLS